MLQPTVLLPLLLVLLSSCCWSTSASGPSTLIGIVGRDYVLLGADTAYSGNGGISLTSSDMDKIHTISHRHERRNPMLAAVATTDLAHAQRFVKILKANVIMREYQDGLGNDVLYVYNKESSNNHHEIEDLGWNVANMAEFARTQMLPSCSMLLGGFIKKQNGKVQNPIISPSVLGSHKNINIDINTNDMINNNYNNNNKNDYSNLQHERLQEQIKAAQNDYKLTSTGCIDSVSTEEEGHQNDDCNFSYQPRLYCVDETQCLIRQSQYNAQGYGSNFILSILDRNYDPSMTLVEAIELLNDCYEQLATRFVLNAPKPPTIKCIYYDKESHNCVIRNVSSAYNNEDAQKRSEP